MRGEGRATTLVPFLKSPKGYSIVLFENGVAESLTRCCKSTFGNDFQCTLCGDESDADSLKAGMCSWEDVKDLYFKQWLAYWTGYEEEELEVTIS